MKILYAVQATGNGHITRARVMAKALKELNVKVDWVFSGRPKAELFDMDVFGDYRVFSGLTFAIEKGRIQYVKTAFKNNLFKFFRDIFSFDFSGYDLVVNDFEPVTAWAAKRQGVTTYGVSHQLAFRKDIPIAGANSLARFILKYFAPVTTPIGLHWDHFGQDLLPPIIDPSPLEVNLSNKDILVYCPFSDLDTLVDWLTPFTDFNFHIFHGIAHPSGFDHIHLYPFSRENFQQKQQLCSGVITSAGFELPSEALDLGQKLLIIPLGNQMEQLSNALALKQINRATIINSLCDRTLKTWLQQTNPTAKRYPNVALEVAKWLVSLENESLASLSKRLWAQVQLGVDAKSNVAQVEKSPNEDPAIDYC